MLALAEVGRRDREPLHRRHQRTPLLADHADLAAEIARLLGVEGLGEGQTSVPDPVQEPERRLDARRELRKRPHPVGGGRQRGQRVDDLGGLPEQLLALR